MEQHRGYLGAFAGYIPFSSNPMDCLALGDDVEDEELLSCNAADALCSLRNTV